MTTTATATASKPTTGTPKSSNGNGKSTGLVTPISQAKGFSIDAVVAKMRDLHDESDRWRLAEELFRQIPTGVAGFEQIIAKANEEGVTGKLSVNTLRLYRDTASRWPSDQRVKGVTFTAHREAANVGDTAKASKLLTSLVKAHGASGVSVTRVREAVRVAQNKPVRPTTRGANSKAATFDVLADVKNGATQLIASIGSDTDADALDKLHAGLTKAIGHVERLRVKAARKAAPKAAPVAKQAAKKAAANGTGRKAGDMRGLR